MNALEDEQAALQEKFYYDPSFGDKLVRFCIEMMRRDSLHETPKKLIASSEFDRSKLPF